LIFAAACRGVRAVFFTPSVDASRAENAQRQHRLSRVAPPPFDVMLPTPIFAT